MPVAGGALTLAAALPFGASNITIDRDDTVLVTTLNGPPNLFRYDPVAQTTTPTDLGIGPMNAITVENVTGNYVLATANAGLPPRSLYWTTPTGTPNLLQNPNLATISCLDINPNPESFGVSSGGSTSYRWRSGGDPDGLPLIGNANFSFTVESTTPMVALGFFLFGFQPVPSFDVFGLTCYIDLANFVAIPMTLNDSAPFVFSLPNDPSTIGDQFFCQALLIESPTSILAASPGLSFTIL